jgi:hypothetical protein
MRVAQWYERKKEGLGDRFVDQVENARERIEANPGGYSLAYRQLRKCDLRKFPYALWFEIRPDDSLVVACLHHKRDEALIKQRLIRSPEP